MCEFLGDFAWVRILLRPLFHFAGFCTLAPPCYGQIVRLQHSVLPVTRCSNTRGQTKVIRNNPRRTYRISQCHPPGARTFFHRLMRHGCTRASSVRAIRIQRRLPHFDLFDDLFCFLHRRILCAVLESPSGSKESFDPQGITFRPRVDL